MSSVTFRMSLVLIAAGVGAVLITCSSDEKKCPACPAGYFCSEATGFQCVPGTTSGCPAAGCGQNATCRSDNVCVCNPGFSDCNDSFADGCECSGSCNGALCGSAAGCDPGTANACGSDTAFCNAGTCQQCAPGTWNCDGINVCESTSACSGVPPTGCSPTSAYDCGKNQYCNNGICATCPPGTWNCDGVNDCESTSACGCDPQRAKDCGGVDMYCTANRTCEECPEGKLNCDGVDICESSTPCINPVSGCDVECLEQDRRKCVKNPARNNYCEECLTDDHCTKNPGSKGPYCDTSDLAGTGWNWCVCKTAADCATSTQGKLCQVSPSGTSNPDFKQCSCKTDNDCVPEFPYCMIYSGGQYVLGRCTPRCVSVEDCIGLGLGMYAICKADGRCGSSDAF